LKNPILEYFSESFEEMEMMKKSTIRNQSLLFILETNEHENSYHSGRSKLFVTELLKLGSTWVENIQNYQSEYTLSMDKEQIPW